MSKTVWTVLKQKLCLTGQEDANWVGTCFWRWGDLLGGCQREKERPSHLLQVTDYFLLFQSKRFQRKPWPIYASLRGQLVSCLFKSWRVVVAWLFLPPTKFSIPLGDAILRSWQRSRPRTSAVFSVILTNVSRNNPWFVVGTVYRKTKLISQDKRTKRDDSIGGVLFEMQLPEAQHISERFFLLESQNDVPALNQGFSWEGNKAYNLWNR